MARRMCSEIRSELHDLNQTQNPIAFHSDGNTALGANEADDNHLDTTTGQPQPGVSAANGAPSPISSGDNWDVSLQSPQFLTGKNPPKRVNYSVSRFNGLSVFEKLMSQSPPTNKTITGLGSLQRLPPELRADIWRLLVPYVDYIRRMPLESSGEVRYDKVPALLLTSHAVSFEYSVELYRINRVLRIVIQPGNELLTSNNSLFQGPKSNADLSRFETLRIEFEFPSLQDLSPIHNPATTIRFEEDPTIKILHNLKLYETLVYGYEEIISQKFSEIENAAKKCPAVQLAFPETRTESWWEKAHEDDTDDYRQGSVEYSKMANVYLETYSIHGEKKLQILLDPKAKNLSRKENKLVTRLLISDNDALPSQERKRLVLRWSWNEARYFRIPPWLRLESDLDDLAAKPVGPYYLCFMFGI